LTATKFLKLDKHGTHVTGGQNVAHGIFGEEKKLPLLYSCIGYNSQGFQRVEKGWAGPSTVNTLLPHPLPAHHLLHVLVFHNPMYITSEQGA